MVNITYFNKDFKGSSSSCPQSAHTHNLRALPTRARADLLRNFAKLFCRLEYLLRNGDQNMKYSSGVDCNECPQEIISLCKNNYVFVNRAKDQFIQTLKFYYNVGKCQTKQSSAKKRQSICSPVLSPANQLRKKDYLK